LKDARILTCGGLRKYIIALPIVVADSMSRVDGFKISRGHEKQYGRPVRGAAGR